MSEGIEIAEEGAVIDFDDAATGEAVRSDLNAKQRSHMRAVWEWVFVVVIAIGAAMFIRVFLFQQFLPSWRLCRQHQYGSYLTQC